jgi:hypothetical protein
MIELIARGGVLLTGLYLIGLAGVSLFAPARATLFLDGFASSARTHYLELVLSAARAPAPSRPLRIEQG